MSIACTTEKEDMDDYLAKMSEQGVRVDLGT